MKWRFTTRAAIRKGDWKLNRLPDRLPQLYHLPKDTAEQRDQVLEYLVITRDFLKALGERDVPLPHPLFLEGPKWNESQLSLYDAMYPLE